MDEERKDYAVGYGKPPAETRFLKGQSGNPGGRPRGAKSLAALLAEALSRRSGFPSPDGSWMTQAEAVFATLVAQAAGPDLKAKRLLFDILVKLHRANICWPQDRLPEIQLPEIQPGEGDGKAGAEVAAEIGRLAQRMLGDGGPRGPAAPEPPVEPPPGDRADPITPSHTP